MEAKDVLTKAAQAVEEAGVPKDLRVVAFQNAIDMLRSGVSGAPAPDSRAGAGSSAGTERAQERAGAALVDRIANRLGVPVDAVEAVFDDADPTRPGLVLPSAALDSRKAAAAKQIGLLIAAARQAAGLDEWTDVDELRRVVEDYNRYDSGNFASAIREIEAIRIRKENNKIQIQLRRPAWDNATALVRSLAGIES